MVRKHRELHTSERLDFELRVSEERAPLGFVTAPPRLQRRTIALTTTSLGLCPARCVSPPQRMHWHEARSQEEDNNPEAQ